MSDTNLVSLVGRLTKPQELKYTRGGKPVGNLSIAVNEVYTSQGARKETVNFFDITLWGQVSESLHQYLIKGKQVSVTGKLRQERWQDDNGNNRSKVVIVCNNIQLLSDPKSQGGQNQNQNQYNNWQNNNNNRSYPGNNQNYNNQNQNYNNQNQNYNNQNQNQNYRQNQNVNRKPVNPNYNNQNNYQDPGDDRFHSQPPPNNNMTNQAGVKSIFDGEVQDPPPEGAGPSQEIDKSVPAHLNPFLPKDSNSEKPAIGDVGVFEDDIPF